MRQISGIKLRDVQNVYGGPEGDLWELVMGEQIHIGGFASSMDLARRAAIPPGQRGVDLCCCTGAGMRFLLRFAGAAHMTGVDATPRSIERGKSRCAEEELAERTTFVLSPATETHLDGGAFDFVWGEDAWCYVERKDQLIAEAARLCRPGGVIAFTDWVEGPTPLTASEAERLLRFMKFPSFAAINDYTSLLRNNGCTVTLAEDTGRFVPHVELYLKMLNMQLTYDALKIIGFDMALMEGMGAEMRFMQDLANAGKIIQGIFVARHN